MTLIRTTIYLKLFMVTLLIISTVLGLLIKYPYVYANIALIICTFPIIIILLTLKIENLEEQRNLTLLFIMYAGLGYIMIGLFYIWVPFISITNKSVIYYFWFVFQLIFAILAIISGFNCIIIGAISHDYEEYKKKKKIKLSFKHNSLGLKHYRKGNYDKAIAAFKKAIRILPDNSETWHNLGMSYVKNHLFHRAIAVFNRAIEEEEKEDPITRNFLGYAYYKVRKYDKAIEELKKSLELNPYYKKAIYNLANVYLMMEHYDEALKRVEKCLEINSDSEKCKRLKDEIITKKDLSKNS